MSLLEIDVQHLLEWIDVLATLVILTTFTILARRVWKARARAMDELREMHKHTHEEMKRIWEKMK